MNKETMRFQAEVSKILDIVVNSLYSQRDVFLREMISNASDACDKLRYEALSQPALLEGDRDFKIVLSIDKEAGTLTIADNGIGMSRDDIVENLGTIAHSGAGTFLERLGEENRGDVSLIGQFGVGFYSAFMVADKVSATTCKAGETHGWHWESAGRDSFTLGEAPDARRGAVIVLHLKEDAREFLEAARIETIVKTYSDHIDLPVILKGGRDGKSDDVVLNTASALWTRPKADVAAEQYKEFYRHSAHAFDDPWMTLHFKAEGALEYTALLFIPSAQPSDLFRPERKAQVKLYVKRVFILDDCEDLLPPYLRFVRGVIDSSDLPLNVSREMLQNNPVLTKIRQGLVARLLTELKKKSEDAEAYAAFWKEFGAVLKEGLYEDFERRSDLLALARFRSTAVEGLTSLAEAKARMKDGQNSLYYLLGESEDMLRKSPQLEGFVAKGVEVLLLDDPIDGFWPLAVTSYEGTPLKAAAKGAADLNAITGESSNAAETNEAPPDESLQALIAALKTTLDAAVRDVRVTDRLTSSPCCLVADDGEMSPHLQRLLRMRQGSGLESPPHVLEINPRHRLIRQLSHMAQTSADSVADAAFLLLDQARIVEGEPLSDPSAFAVRLTRLLEQASGPRP